MYLYICPSRDNQTSLQTRKPPIPPAALPVPSLRLSPPSLFTSLSPFLLCFSAVPIQLAQQQHGEPGEPRNVRQPLQLRERLLVGRAHPFALLPAQLHVWGPFACPDHPLQHRLPWTACLPGVLPTVQHRQVCNMDREYTNFPVCVHVCVHVCVFRLLWCTHKHVHLSWKKNRPNFLRFAHVQACCVQEKVVHHSLIHLVLSPPL